MELVVIGTTGFLPGFALAGVRKTVLADASEVMRSVEKHHDSIIILDERLASALPQQQREMLETSTRPVVITLAKDGAAQEARLRRAIMNTLGVDLLR
jgi:vacuolar-type H+-ATPase subunit F/Vma7